MDSRIPAFDVVVPSLPGFGFSGPTRSRGWDTVRMAKAFIVLMDRLGYSRYGIQGGDWGSEIARQMARQAPTRVVGLHLNLLPVLPPSPDAMKELTAEEHRRYSQWWDEGRSAFFNLQSIEPQTAAYALTDSPSGWMTWLAVKFQDLTDNDGDFLHTVDRDAFLTNATLYWVTGTVGSSMRIYRESRLSDSDQTPPRFLKQERGFADSTIINRMRSLSPFLAWLAGRGTPLSKVAPATISAYFTTAVAGRWKRPRSPPSVKRFGECTKADVRDGG